MTLSNSKLISALSFSHKFGVITKPITLLTIVLCAACSHPLEIQGQGDIVSASGTRNCSLEEQPCQNFVANAYSETYSAVPRAGYVFTGWEGCSDQQSQCSFSVSEEVVQQNWLKTMPPLIAKFEQDDVNAAPIMSIPNVVNVEENSNFVVTLTATDEDSPANAITFSLNGADASVFNLDGSVLSFIEAPNFEMPICGEDNNCELSVIPSDGVNTGTPHTLTVSITDIPRATAQTTVAVEGDSGTKNAVVRVNLEQAQTSSFTYITSDAGGTAESGVDFTATSGTINFTGGSVTASIEIPIIGDSNTEPDEEFYIIFNNGSNLEFDNDTHADLQASITVQIEDNDSIRSYSINDTGIGFAALEENDDEEVVKSSVCVTTALVAAQDCGKGRDAQASAGSLVKVGGGQAGFDFTKLGADGTPLAIQNASYSNTGNEVDGTSWACVHDNHTGLTWEVKTQDGSVHDKTRTFRWGGLTAVGRQHSGRYGEHYDDWNVLIETANDTANSGANGLCGFTDWRVPKVPVLHSIIHFGRVAPMIDTNYFPNTESTFYWTSTPDFGELDAIYVHFEFGVSYIYSEEDYEYDERTNLHSVRLVRGQ